MSENKSIHAPRPECAKCVSRTTDCKHGQADREGAAVKVSIMQPYLVRYIGYFQLLNPVDRVVSDDDVNYVKDGWGNRAVRELIAAGGVA